MAARATAAEDAAACPAHRPARTARRGGRCSPCASVPPAPLAPGAAGGAPTPGCAGRELGAGRRTRACAAAGHGQPAVVPARSTRCDKTRGGLPRVRAAGAPGAARHAQPARSRMLAAALVWCLVGIATAKVCDSSVRFSPDDACNIQIDAGPHGALGIKINFTSAVAYPRWVTPMRWRKVDPPASDLRPYAKCVPQIRHHHL